jgi:SulP family sulfate permease
VSFQFAIVRHGNFQIIGDEMAEISAEKVSPAAASRFITAMRPASLVAVLTGGLITGLLQVVLTVSYAALVYGGKLSPYVGQGIGYALAGAFIIASVVALFASLPGSVGNNQDAPVVIFSLISASIVGTMPPDSSLEATFYTVVTAIALTTLLTGFFFFGLGTFRLGGLVRYLPYPVVGGFLAGTGWLLFKGGFSLMNGRFAYADLLQLDYITHWLPGFLLAVTMFLAVKRFQNTYVFPGLILGGTLLFYGSTWLMGYSPAELSAQGWLLGPFPEPTLWQPFTPAQLSMANWTVIADQSANITTVLMVSSLSMLLNASGLELAAKKNIDLDRELRSTGIGNLISGLSPGFVGFLQISLSVLNLRINACNRIVGLLGVAIIGLALLFGASIITYFPKVIMGAVLMYLGMTFLVEWTYNTLSKLPKIDIFIIWMILLIIAAFGFLQGVAVGFLAAVIMFAVSCSLTEVVRHELTGKTYQSQVTRLPDQHEILDAEGGQLYILQLQGFIFFGTVDRLYNQVKARLSDRNKPLPRFVVIDFRRVANLDSTGMLSFMKLKDLTAFSNIHIVITAPTAKIQRQLEQGGLPVSDTLIHYFSSLDDGLEWCEDEILQQFGVVLDEKPPSLEKQLSVLLPETTSLSPLIDYLERQEIDPGVTIIRQGEVPDDLFFIESGRITTLIDQQDGSSLRLETMRNGRIVGEIGFFLGQNRCASVITDEHSIIYRLSAEDLKQLEKDMPETAAVFHQVIIRLMAHRVTHLIKTINALQK